MEKKKKERGGANSPDYERNKKDTKQGQEETRNGRPLQPDVGRRFCAKKHTLIPNEKKRSHGNRLRVVYVDLVILGVELSLMYPTEPELR